MKHTLNLTVILLFPFVFGMLANQKNNNRSVKDFAGEITDYPEHIAGAYTGGFGEQSCHSCHFDYDLNPPEGEILITGIEDTFEPGQQLTIGISLKREDMKKAGFQMTARFEDGSQAGHFEPGENLTNTPNINSDVMYVQHKPGEVDAENGEKNWQITWTAGEQDKGNVVFNIAANAANGDASEFGDWIYVKEIRIEPQP